MKLVYRYIGYSDAGAIEEQEIPAQVDAESTEAITAFLMRSEALLGVDVVENFLATEDEVAGD